MPTDSTPPFTVNRRRALATIGLTGAAVASASVLSACTGDGGPIWTGTEPEESPEPAPKASVTIASPKADAADVPASAELKFTSAEAVETKITLVEEATGKNVPGAMHPDGAGWLPKKALKYDHTYTATVAVTGDDGKTVEATSTFTTMATPGKTVAVSSFLADDAVFGSGMPLIFRTSRSVPTKHRAALQRRLMVQTEPHQEGIWTWYNDRELHWRPREYWQPNTKVFVNCRVGGLPLGDGYYGKRDVTLTASSANRVLTMTVDNKVAPKVLKVVKDGKTIRSIPVSLGKPTWESSSGAMVIIERLKKTVFDTTNDPDAREAYRVDIEYAQRTTWGGEFIHAAPWSVQHQGIRNVSHGCINMSQENAKWLFDQTRVGDVVIVKGTGRKLEYGNGWTDWNKPWEEYVKGSAIPYEPPAEPSEEPDDSDDPSPEATA